MDSSNYVSSSKPKIQVYLDVSQYSRHKHKWASTRDSGTYPIGELQWLLRAYAFAHPRQSIPFSHSQSMVPKWVSTRDSGHLSHWWAAMTHTSLSICTVSPVPLHFAYTKYGIQATNTRGPAQRDSGTHRISASSDGSYEHRHYAIQPEPSLHVCTKYGSRGSVRQSLQPLAR